MAEGPPSHFHSPEILPSREDFPRKLGLTVAVGAALLDLVAAYPRRDEGIEIIARSLQGFIGDASQLDWIYLGELLSHSQEGWVDWPFDRQVQVSLGEYRRRVIEGYFNGEAEQYHNFVELILERLYPIPLTPDEVESLPPGRSGREPGLSTKRKDLSGLEPLLGGNRSQP